MTLGGAATAVVNAIANLTFAQAISLGLFVGGIGVAIYLWVKGHRKLHKNPAEEKTTDPVETIEVDGAGASLADILADTKKKAKKDASSVVETINADLDDDLNHRSTGATHHYSKKSADKDFSALNDMKRGTAGYPSSKRARNRKMWEDFVKSSERFAANVKEFRGEDWSPATV